MDATGVGILEPAAALHTDLTFDRRMLALAGGLWEGGDPSVTQAIDKLNGLAVHNYHYSGAGLYDPRLVDGVRQAYARLGWQHMVLKGGAHGNGAGAVDVEPGGAPANGSIDRSTSVHGATDLWVRLDHMQVTGAVVLFESPNNVALVAVSGNLSPIDLLHLRGHFGIPALLRRPVHSAVAGLCGACCDTLVCMSDTGQNYSNHTRFDPATTSCWCRCCWSTWCSRSSTRYGTSPFVAAGRWSWRWRC